MSDKPRFVFDANVLVSASLFKGSAPDQALRFAFDTGEILLSTDTILELRDVFARPKFDRYLPVEERNEFLVKLIRRSVLTEVTETVAVCRDPRDDKYLALAVAGSANAVISGDADLLTLHSFQGIPILSPAEFLASRRPK